VNEYKQGIQKEIDDIEKTIIGISAQIHDNPELGLREHKACELLTSEIEEFGFNVDTPVAGLDTAFVATYKGEKRGPKIALLAEYDALPALGHGCGHNIIAASSFGAAVALRNVASRLGGTIALYGTPDEEAVDVRSRGGKVIMVEAGLFRDVDVAIMMHPTGGVSKVWNYSFPSKDFTVRYLGKPAHYTVYHKGINALESLLAFLDNVHMLKRGWTPDVMFAYTITDGGGPSPIVVPESAEVHITMKTFYPTYLKELYSQVKRCAESIASMSGANVEIQEIGEYKSMIPNLNLSLSLYNNLRYLNMEVENPIVSQRRLERLTYPGASTDFGDVSWVVPGIHGYISLGGEELIAHTREFTEAAGSAPGHQAVILAAKAMAMTAVDILSDAESTRNIKKEFHKHQVNEFRNVPGIPPDYPSFPQEFLRDFEAS